MAFFRCNFLNDRDHPNVKRKMKKWWFFAVSMINESCISSFPILSAADCWCPVQIFLWLVLFISKLWNAHASTEKVKRFCPRTFVWVLWEHIHSVGQVVKWWADSHTGPLVCSMVTAHTISESYPGCATVTQVNTPHADAAAPLMCQFDGAPSPYHRGN